MRYIETPYRGTLIQLKAVVNDVLPCAAKAGRPGAAQAQCYIQGPDFHLGGHATAGNHGLPRHPTAYGRGQATHSMLPGVPLGLLAFLPTTPMFQEG